MPYYIGKKFRLVCPKKIDGETKSIGVVHKPEEDWWHYQKLSLYSTIVDSTPEKEAAHAKIFNEEEKECESEKYWWGSKDATIIQTKYSYIFNSTLLPGHAGLSCRSDPSSKEFYGIVQDTILV
jgi:hypothetical protein